ncbi:MAG: hypothetical protein M9925_00720 [Chloroflexi bacterium]|nr:hypothetical protein [Chloroflexota bacterium]
MRSRRAINPSGHAHAALAEQRDSATVTGINLLIGWIGMIAGSSGAMVWNRKSRWSMDLS